MKREVLGFILCLCFIHLAGSVPSLADFKCSKKSGKFPKPGSACKSYYECANWKAKEAKCRGKEHFFPEKGYCVRPELYPCFEKPKNKECPLPNGKFLKPKTRCKAYYDCCDGVPKEKRCSPGQLFSQTREICDWSELVTCLEENTLKECPRPDGTFLKPNSDCKVYYECRDGVPTERRCRVGLLFNSESGICDWSELVTCPEDIKTTKNTLTPTSTVFLTSTTDSESSSDESSSSSDEGSSSEEEGIRSSTKSRTNTPKFTASATYSTDGGKVTTEIMNTNPTIVTEESKSSKNHETSLTTSNFVLSSTTENGTKSNINTDSDFVMSSSANPDLLSTSSSFTVPITEDVIDPKINTDSDFKISSSVSPDFPNTLSSFVPLSTTDTGTETNIITEDKFETPFTTSSPTFSSTTGKITKPVVDTLSTSTSTTITVAENITNDYDEKISISSKVTPEWTTFTETLGNKDSDSTTESSFITESVTFDIICPESDGYYPHPNDRHKFVACIGGNVVILECPSNLVYDHKKRSCQYN